MRNKFIKAETFSFNHHVVLNNKYDSKALARYKTSQKQLLTNLVKATDPVYRKGNNRLDDIVDIDGPLARPVEPNVGF